MSATFSPAFRPITPEYLKGGRLLQLLDAWGWHMQKALQNPQDGSDDAWKQTSRDMRAAWNSLLPLVDPGENWQFRTTTESLYRQRARQHVDGSVTPEASLTKALTDLQEALRKTGLEGDAVPRGLQNVELTVIMDPTKGPRFEARDTSPPLATDEVDKKQLSMVVVMVIGGLLGIAAILMIVWLARRRKKGGRS